VDLKDLLWLQSKVTLKFRLLNASYTLLSLQFTQRRDLRCLRVLGVCVSLCLNDLERSIDQQVEYEIRLSLVGVCQLLDWIWSLRVIFERPILEV
jgi:hypothetical protein